MAFQNIFSKKPLSKKTELKIIADHREKPSKLIPILLEKNFNIEFRQLPVADYLINNIAIERKTLSDLKSSIINKRLIQQLLEIKQYPQHFLIIEGNPKELYTPPLHENATRGLLLSITLEFRTPIIFTQSAEDTAKYFLVLAKKKPIKEQSLRAFKILKTNKEKALFILEGFPNIGPVSAKKLLKKFKTLKNIFNSSLPELKEILGKKAEAFHTLINRKL